MKRTFILVITIMLVMAFNGCGHSSKSVNEILELPNEQPTSIVVLFDDPNMDPLVISDKNEINTIISMLYNRTYKKVKNVTPKSNTRLRFIYDNGIEKIIALNGIVDSCGTRYEPMTVDDLESMILSLSSY